MGLDDRDYMRERYRKRRGLPPEDTRWNDKGARVERDDAGSDGTARGGPWFAPKNQGFDYQKNRWRPGRKKARHGDSAADDGVPLDSASWIGKDAGKEFEIKNPGYKARPHGTARGGAWDGPLGQHHWPNASISRTRSASASCSTSSSRAILASVIVVFLQVRVRIRTLPKIGDGHLIQGRFLHHVPGHYL